MDNKTGRKGKYKTHVEPRLEEIKHWCRDGLTDLEIATRLGVSVTSLVTYKKEHSELLDTLIEGKAIADYRVEDALYKRALGYKADETIKERKFNEDTGEYETIITKIVTKEVAPDPTSMIWWLKNRKPEQWRDRQEIKLDGDLNVETKYNHLTDEELEAEVMKMKKALENE